MLGLGKKIIRDPFGVRPVIGKHQRLARSSHRIYMHDPEAEQIALCRRHEDISGTDYDIGLLYALSTESDRGNP